MNIACLARRNSLISSITLVIAFTILMVISAYVRIPLFFTPVPITMQTFTLFLSIVVLGRRAFFPQLSYILLGVGGLPVFTNGGAGFIYLLGPTGGYIVGFLLAALILPFCLPEQRTFLKMFFVFLLGALIYYLSGVSWLVFFHKFTLLAALAAGVLPFILADIVKIVLVSFLALKGK